MRSALIGIKSLHRHGRTWIMQQKQFRLSFPKLVSSLNCLEKPVCTSYRWTNLFRCFVATLATCCLHKATVMTRSFRLLRRRKHKRGQAARKSVDESGDSPDLAYAC